MSKKSKDGGERPPVKPIQDLSVPEIAKMHLRALRSGDATEIKETLEASIPPEPPREAPIHYAIELPILALDGTPTVGRSMKIIYSGQGLAIEIEIDGLRISVNGYRLSSVANMLATAIGSTPPHPIPFIGRPYPL